LNYDYGEFQKSIFRFSAFQEIFMYYVFVCPKCKLSAQLLESGYKTVGCFRCGARIKASSLHFFGSFDDRNEAVRLRSVLQGQLDGSFSVDAAMPPLLDLPVQNNEAKTSEPIKKTEVRTKMPKASKAVEIIRRVLSENGAMSLVQCESYCEECGISREKFQQVIQKMIESGEIFRPKKGFIALVPE
jgi:transposase-like protein